MTEVKPATCPKEIAYPPGWNWGACGRRAGQSGFCGIHSPEAVQKRRDKSARLYAAKQERSPYTKLERLRAALASERKLRRELQEALEDLRLACSLVPAMNHRDYDPLGARVNKALARATEHDAERQE